MSRGFTDFKNGFLIPINYKIWPHENTNKQENAQQKRVHKDCHVVLKTNTVLSRKELSLHSGH